MTKQQVTIKEAFITVVLLGEFNVLHHQPEKLLKYGLINQEDFDLSKISILSLSQMHIDLSWGKLLVEAVDNKTFRLSACLFDMSCLTLFNDFVKSLINYNDTATPYVIGLNFLFLLQHKNKKEWDEFGHALTPKTTWKNIFPTNDSHFGMNNISIKIDSIFKPTFASEERDPELNISLKPIDVTPHGDTIKYGTECGMNYHFPLDINNASLSAMDIFDKYFLSLQKDSEIKIRKIIEEF